MQVDEEYLLGKELFAYIKRRKSSWNIFKLDWLKNQMLKVSMVNPELQSQLFRFVDVLPVLNHEKEKADFLRQYLEESGSNLATLTKIANSNSIFRKILNIGVDFSVKQLAKTFICASTVDEAFKKTQALLAKNQAYTLDILGELALNQREADEYFNQYLELIREIPHVNISVKLSALHAQINPLDFNGKKEYLKNRLRAIYREAKTRGAFINVDTEHYFWKDFTFELVREVLEENEFKDWSAAGIVIQAYLQDSEEDTKEWISWARRRGAPITVRLVKGAYWDYEHAIARQHNWPCPVYTNKYDSDINYENLTELLLKNHRYLRPAFASHNIRSLTHVLSLAEDLKVEKSRFEMQMLYGMLDELKDFFSEHNFTLRVYMPYGELIPGMSYLVRRLLENTANDSFLRQGFLDGKSEDRLLIDPRIIKENDKKKESKKLWLSNFTNAANLDFSKNFNRIKMTQAISKLEKELNEETLYPLVINGEKRFNDNCFESVNPANPAHILGRISHSTIEDCDTAIAAAQEAQAAWFEAGPKLRAEVLENCAQRLESQRYKFNALLCLEAGKPWQEADGELSEAVDFLKYYADQATRLFEEDKLRSLPGERNTNHYQAYGVSAVIPPWNFPLAIMAGMSVASLAVGNSIIVKPSGQTSIIAYEFLELLQKSLREICPKLAPGLVNFLPGEGRTIGEALVKDPRVRLIAFTGSDAVGLRINEKASKARPPKRVIAEMGGKNAIIIDRSADLDEAIPGLLYSAFGYAGQKCSACSRVIVEESIYEHFTHRLQEACKEINVGDPRDDACFVPPVIDMNAEYKIQQYIKQGKKDGHMLVGDLEIPEKGFYVSPTIFTNIDPKSKLAQEEIFGPVLVVLKASDIDDAITIANGTQFGLTGGIYSRSPENIRKIRKEFITGNLYINRPSTGAIVSRQAFGGLKNSSIGFKAGGPNYLLQFVQEKTITENTMRRGFTVD